MNFSKLAILIKNKKLNQRLLAKEIGFSQTAVSQAMTRKDMKVSMLEKIAGVLGVSPCYFFEDNKSNYEITNNSYQANENIAVYGKKQNVPVLLEKIKGLEKEYHSLNIFNIIRNKESHAIAPDFTKIDVEFSFISGLNLVAKINNSLKNIA